MAGQEGAEHIRAIVAQTTEGRTALELRSLNIEMGAAFRQAVEQVRVAYDITANEALIKTLEMLAPAEEGRYDPDAGVPSWWGLQKLALNNAAEYERKWERMKQQACDDLDSGMTAARSLEALPGDHTPEERAQFLVLREALISQWRAQPGIEMMLIDTLAMVQTQFMYWTQQLSMYSAFDGKRVKRGAPGTDEKGYPLPPRVTHYDAVEQAASMADLFNRMLLRTLRQLRDLRRYTPAVNIGSVGQLNLGAQQVNVSDNHGQQAEQLKCSNQNLT